MGDKYQNPGLYLTPRQIIRLLDTLFSIIFKHRTKRISGCGRKPPGRQRHIIETRSESVSLRPQLKNEADIQVKRPHSVVCSDFTPLYSFSKAPRIKSIEISINKTEHKTEERGKLPRKENTSSQQEEDMFKDKEVTQIQNLFASSGPVPGQVKLKLGPALRLRFQTWACALFWFSFRHLHPVYRHQIPLQLHPKA